VALLYGLDKSSGVSSVSCHAAPQLSVFVLLY
jgi:hypothetical protein